ncbi:MAG: phosphatidylinositol kinase [Bacteroidetes bacterium]|nr:MAG: phosphatidylinositol kinase [Bacteroidota bacterium]
MRKAKIYMHDKWAGTLTEDENGYHFQYNKDYLSSENPEPVSLTLPLQQEAYHSQVMFSFFDGLIPEGWLLNIAERNWKLDSRDRMGLLLTTCYDCVGAVSIIPFENEDNE